MFTIPKYEWKPVILNSKVEIMAGDSGCTIAELHFGRSRPMESDALVDAAAMCAVPEMYAALRAVKECDLPELVREQVEAALRKADRSI